MNFKQFILNEENELSDLEIASMYFQKGKPIRLLSKDTNKSIGEIYRIVHSYGKPNRMRNSRDLVVHLDSSGMNKESISKFTGYTSRHISNILKK